MDPHFSSTPRTMPSFSLWGDQQMAKHHLVSCFSALHRISALALWVGTISET
jgi:hypothetical protein